VPSFAHLAHSWRFLFPFITNNKQLPQGFNRFAIPPLSNDFYSDNGISFGAVIISAIPVTILVYLESVSIARKYALDFKYPLDMTQVSVTVCCACIARVSWCSCRWETNKKNDRRKTVPLRERTLPLPLIPHNRQDSSLSM